MSALEKQIGGSHYKGDIMKEETKTPDPFHSFSAEEGLKYGVKEAVVLNKIVFEIKNLKSNNMNFYDDRTWIRSSIKNFTVIHPYFTFKQIRNILNSLIKQKVIIAGNCNKSEFNTTKWYALAGEPKI